LVERVAHIGPQVSLRTLAECGNFLVGAVDGGELPHVVGIHIEWWAAHVKSAREFCLSRQPSAELPQRNKLD